MELKSYQKKVIADLTRYLELLNETQNYMTAFGSSSGGKRAHRL